MLDMVPKEMTAEEKARGLTLESPQVRNRIVPGGPGTAGENEAGGLLSGDSTRPGSRRAISTTTWPTARVRLGGRGGHRKHADQAEAFPEKIVPNLAPGAVLSTNTSGLSVNAMAEALPVEVRRNFLVTHFFNPPRYMRLLEIVACEETDPAVVYGMAEFISRRLGKGIVYAKDTPNFIANRIGVYAIYKGMQHMLEMGMTVEEVDAIAGPATAGPKSAAFRTADLVGIDTLVHVGNNSYELLPEDEEREVFKVPDS